MSSFISVLKSTVIKAVKLVFPKKLYYRYANKYANFRIYCEYRNNVKCVENKKDRQLKIAFIISYPSSFTSVKTVYEAAVLRGIHSLILCVSNNNEHSTMREVESHNGDWPVFKLDGKDAVYAYNSVTDKWYDLEKWNPQYVFYVRPYEGDYPDIYSFRNVSKYAKICYIPYGYLFSKNEVFRSVYGRGLWNYTYRTFVTSKSCIDMLTEEYGSEKRNLCRYVDLGFPRFDLYTDVKNNDRTDCEYEHTVTWLPRWKFADEKGQKLSHFLEYYDEFMNFVKEHREVKFILRPHPLMFRTIVKETDYTTGQVEQMKNEIMNMPNLFLDETDDYMHTLFETDILLADATSLIAEFFVMERPVIYCDGINDYNEDGIMISNALYMEEKWDDVKKRLLELFMGNDPMKEQRKQVIARVIGKNDGNIGNNIVDYIINDFER